jgi:hypothetical protein
MDPQTIPQLNPSGAKTIADVPHAAAIKHPNWFIHFSENIGHAIVDIFKWAPTVANKVIFVLEAESKLTPEFLSALKTFITDAAVVAGSAAGAVANKGVNPTLDVATFTAVEQLVKDFVVFYPVLQAAVGALEGHVPTSSALPGTVTAAEASATTSTGVSVEPTANLQAVADNMANDAGETQKPVSKFVAKVASPTVTESSVVVNETPTEVKVPE